MFIKLFFIFHASAMEISMLSCPFLFIMLQFVYITTLLTPYHYAIIKFSYTCERQVKYR